MKNGSWRSAAVAALLGMAVPARAASGSDAEFGRAAGAVMTAALVSAKGLKPGRAPVQPALPESSEGTLVSDKTTTVGVALNAQTVKCSAADYSGPMLKVLVPALAELTLLNHRNTREGAPCVAAGRCGEMSPADILAGGEGTEQVPVRVVLRKVAEPNGEECSVTLVETVAAVIRGVPFFHERRQALADRVAGDCR